MKNTLKILLILLVVISTRCLDDSGVPAEDIVLDDTAKILRYIESTGDFANTDLAPALVSAAELFNNSAQYFILDIRTPEEYSVGHIESAVNISSADLYQVVDSLYKNYPFKKIAVVSKNGQASSYFTCLLRLAKFTNVYTLNYGMASWNIDFANEWLSALADNSQTYDNILYDKRNLSSLPHLEFPQSINSQNDVAIYRIKKIITNGFLKDINFFEEIIVENSLDYFFVCYGEGRLYNAPRELGSQGHPQNTVWFQNTPVFEFRSVNSLQTLPNDQPILIYSGDGQLSACMTAYLTVLGYNVKTLLFGANQLFYWRLNADPLLTDYVFSTDDIMNYPYVSGK